MICGDCSAPVPSPAAFCPACGARFVTPVPGHTILSGASWTCGDCSAPVPPPAAFCPRYGGRFVTPVPVPTMSKGARCFLWGLGLLAFLLVCFLVLAVVGLTNAFLYINNNP